MVELRDIDKIKEGKEQKTYTANSLIIVSIFSFLLGIIVGMFLQIF